MKVSVSLPDKNIEFLEAYALRRGLVRGLPYFAGQ